MLHDRLLALFDEHPDVQPANVLVLTPSLQEYGGAIESVFATAGRIPFHVARPPAAETRAVRAFLDLLALPGSRYGAEAVLAPLECASVRAHRHPGRAAGQRARLGAQRRHPLGRGWRAPPRGGVAGDGGTRVAAGSASPAARLRDGWRRRRVRGYRALPHPQWGARGGVGGLRGPRSVRPVLRRGVRAAGWLMDALVPGEWCARLRDGIVGTFFAGDERGSEVRDRHETAALLRLIDEFEAQCQVGTPIPWRVLRDALGEAANPEGRAVARLADGVTVAALGAGQAFPAKIVCAVGMNDRSFPRSPAPPTFDVLAADEERRGDRNVRDEDRFAFLEALLSARRAFLVTYTGRGLRDDAPIPPSVVVDELREYLARRFGAEEFEARHPLQPFSRRYFDGSAPALFSYAENMLEAAAAIGGGAAAGAPSRFAHTVARFANRRRPSTWTPSPGSSAPRRSRSCRRGCACAWRWKRSRWRRKNRSNSTGSGAGSCATGCGRCIGRGWRRVRWRRRSPRSPGFPKRPWGTLRWRMPPARWQDSMSPWASTRPPWPLRLSTSICRAAGCG